MLANPTYAIDFNYIAVSVKNREAFIEDSDSDDGNNKEQSDMVSTLMNLAYNENIHHKYKENKAKRE